MSSILERYGKDSKFGRTVTTYAKNIDEACEILYDCEEIVKISQNTYRGFEFKRV